MRLESALAQTLADRAGTSRWRVSTDRFQVALERSVEKAFPEGAPGASHVRRYLEGLHLSDLALACACADGDEGAWEHFVREFRQGLYRAAGAIDRSDGSRELADTLYADLFGLKERDGERQSLLRYFHGRSSLSTWLRSVLAQRHIDRVRAERRIEPLSDSTSEAIATDTSRDSPDRARHARALLVALESVVAALAPRDRLRLAWYHAQGLTLAQIGKLTREHEATVSRHLTRTRREVRKGVEERLGQQGMADAEIAECFEEAIADPGTFDVRELLGEEETRKDLAPDRSPVGGKQ